MFYKPPDNSGNSPVPPTFYYIFGCITVFATKYEKLGKFCRKYTMGSYHLKDGTHLGLIALIKLRYFNLKRTTLSEYYPLRNSGIIFGPPSNEGKGRMSVVPSFLPAVLPSVTNLIFNFSIIIFDYFVSNKNKKWPK